jgi:myosin heavy subunit
MDKIGQSNPILEAVGNSRTVRNNNSSRFGKFIDLSFDENGALCGGSVRTYLLENVRVVNQQPGERNFHIFYQVIAGADEKEKERWRLTRAEDYHYINQGRISKIPMIDDKKNFQNLKTGLLHFLSPENVEMVFDIIAGLLHLGQTQFDKHSDLNGDGSVVRDHKLVELVASLFGLSAIDLTNSFTQRVMISRGERFVKKMHTGAATNARDAIAKALYKKTFDWIVRELNSNIQTHNVMVAAHVGILDIFGLQV